MPKFKVGDTVYMARYAPSNIVSEMLPAGELLRYIKNAMPFIIVRTRDSNSYTVKHPDEATGDFVFYEAELELVNKYTNTSLKSGGNI